MARQTRSERRARRAAQAESRASVERAPQQRQPQPARPPADAKPASDGHPSSGRRGGRFISESWAELQKVDWPGQQQRFRRVVVPTEQVVETKDGQKVQTEKRILPGYVLVNMDLNDEAWTVVKNTPGVTGFVGAGSKPVPLSQGEVDRILRTGAATGERPRAQVEFSLGESVKVTSGPLSDFDGEIVDVNPDQQKLKVLVDIFERQVPVELGFDQVKKID